MQPELTLNITDELGHTRKVVVQSKRFTIGRAPDNDLSIENSSLSRRHAVIESFEGIVQITDCGSQNGTEVNGVPIAGGTVLHDGDVITLGGVCDVVLSVSSAAVAPAVQTTQTKSVPPERRSVATKNRDVAAPAPGERHFGSAPVVAATVAILVILVAGGLLFFVLRQDHQRRRTSPGTVNNVVERPSVQTETPISNGTLDSDELSNGGSKVSVTEEKVEKAAAGVMRRISSDDKVYSFSEKTLQEIGRKVDHYRASTSLPGSLTATQRSASTLAVLARREGIEPGLLIYAVLAQTDGGRTGGDPVVVARGMISDLLALRALFGVGDADSSLILIAAFKMGRGEKRSHPLLVTIRRLVKQPLIQRNVWYLHERDGLNPQAYDFVVSFLALGAIAQDPRQFGVEAPPLVF